MRISMERIYEKEIIENCIAKSKYHAVLRPLDLNYALTNYEKGELAILPFQSEKGCRIKQNIYKI